MEIAAKNLDFKELNHKIRTSKEDVCIKECYGQRFIGIGCKDKNINIYGTPGNALGAYLNGGEIHVHGNVQDAVGDTMNQGKIVIHGDAGDALGYAMRGGCIYVRGDAGYRTGIHMKEFQDKRPVIVVGGKAGSFLGEYLAGGILIVLNMESDPAPIGNFTGTGMHGGKIFIRTKEEPTGLPKQVESGVISPEDLEMVTPYLNQFAEYFGIDPEELIKDQYYVLRPNARNPYKQLYVAN